MNVVDFNEYRQRRLADGPSVGHLSSERKAAEIGETGATLGGWMRRIWARIPASPAVVIVAAVIAASGAIESARLNSSVARPDAALAVAGGTGCKTPPVSVARTIALHELSRR
jgi:hypothetical protein